MIAGPVPLLVEVVVGVEVALVVALDVAVTVVVTSTVLVVELSSPSLDDPPKKLHPANSAADIVIAAKTSFIAFPPVLRL